MMRTANPILNKNTFVNYALSSTKSMTIQGTVNKTGILLMILLMGAGFTWMQFIKSGSSAVMPLMLLGGIGGFILALVTVFKKHLASITAPAYAAAEGLFLGGLSATLEARYPGIVMQAVGLTFGTLFALLGAYTSGYIKATENFKLGVAAATGGIFVFYMISFVLSFFGVHLFSMNNSMQQQQQLLS